MSTMFSSKSSGGGVVVVRLAMTAIVPRPAGHWGEPTAARRSRRAVRAASGPARPWPGARTERSGRRESAVDEDDLPGDVGTRRAGQEHRDALEVGRAAVAP